MHHPACYFALHDSKYLIIPYFPVMHAAQPQEVSLAASLLTPRWSHTSLPPHHPLLTRTYELRPVSTSEVKSYSIVGMTLCINFKKMNKY